MLYRQFVVFFTICLLSGTQNGLAQNASINYDSSFVKTILPSKAKEKEVFSDKDFNYSSKEAKDNSSGGRFMDWLIDKLFGGVSRERRATIIDFILWTFALAGLGIMIWLLTRTELVNFLKGKTRKTEFNFSDVDEDISGIDFDAKISKALLENNYRLAVRWYYLKQLNKMNILGIIEWQPHKTNIEYSRELQKSELALFFTELSRIYDYTWYGEYNITSDNYIKMTEKFKNFEIEMRKNESVVNV